MGSGNIFKTIVRIVVPAVVAVMNGGPLAVAISAAATTGATGGSFRDTLMAGGTSYIGASIGESLSGSLSAAGDTAMANSLGADALTGGGLESAAAMSAAQNAQNAASNSGWLAELLAEKAPGVASYLNTTTPFADFAASAKSGAGLFSGSNQTAYDVLTNIGNKSLGSLGATAVGSLSGLSLESTLNQALDANDLDALKNMGFTNEAIQVLSEERRRQMVQEQYDNIRKSTENPGLPTDEFDKIIATGLDNVNKSLGGITKGQFDQVFRDPKSIGTNILNEEQTNRRNAFVNKLKTGIKSGSDIFTPISDDDAIKRILDEQEGPAFKQVSTLEARGALNQLGGKSARQSIESQRSKADERLQSIGESIRSRNISSLDAIRNEGLTGAENYKLGDALFDEKPFVEKSSSLRDQLFGSLEGDIRSQLGNEKLYDTNSALSSAGRTQGVVSGKGANGLLDVLAQRGLTDDSRKRRGLGTVGSGAF